MLATSLTACGEDVRDETVRLAGVRDAVVVSGGTERPASDGTELGKGDRVRTGTNGTATLVVRERRVVLGGATDVGVPDGATVDLARGALLVDRRRGPGLTVRAGDTTVDRIDTGALRIERSLTVLVAALSAPARVQTVTGQRIALDPLHELGVSGRALPRGVVPLLLRYDAWEREVIPGVLADDALLNDLAAGLDGPEAPVIPALYRPGAGLRASEALLPAAIGRAVGGAAARRAAELRAQGGSWGVVAAILRTNAIDVSAALTDVLKGTPARTQPPGTSGAPDPGTVAGGTPSPGVGSSPRPTTPPPTSGSPKPTPSPTRSTDSPSPTPSTFFDEIGKIIPTPRVPLPSVGTLLGS